MIAYTSRTGELFTIPTLTDLRKRANQQRRICELAQERYDRLSAELQRIEWERGELAQRRRTAYDALRQARAALRSTEADLAERQPCRNRKPVL